MGSTSLRSHERNSQRFPQDSKQDGYSSVWRQSPRVYGKLPFGRILVQIQHELSTAGKSEASVEGINLFI